MDELQACVEQPLAVLPQTAIFLQPRKAALNDPAPRHHLESVQFTALGYLHPHMRSQNVLGALRKGLPHVATVVQQAPHPMEPGLASLQCLQRPLAICHLRRGDGHRVRQTLGIHRNMTLDARDLLACVIALQSSRVRVLHALRVHDQERAASAAPQSLAGRANLIF